MSRLQNILAGGKSLSSPLPFVVDMIDEKAALALVVVVHNHEKRLLLRARHSALKKQTGGQFR